MRPSDGALLALVGGFDFDRNKFNHVTQAQRQPGSAFKPFIYSAALEKGFTPATVVNDAPFFVPADKAGGEDWEPKNYDGKFEGPMRVRAALAKSKNLVTVRVLQAIGPRYAQDYIARFGFDPKLHPPYLTMGLGAGSATPLQMVDAFAVFANGGYRVTPYLIAKIVDARGNVLSEAAPTVAGEGAELAIDSRNAWIMTSLLKDVVRVGTATRALSLNRTDLAGKTGTTNENVDAWFCGYNAALVAVSWIGFDQPRTLGTNETGAVAALPIWISYMAKVLKGTPRGRPADAGRHRGRQDQRRNRPARRRRRASPTSSSRSFRPAGATTACRRRPERRARTSATSCSEAMTRSFRCDRLPAASAAAPATRARGRIARGSRRPRRGSSPSTGSPTGRSPSARRRGS